jgi:hypothetical protein
MEPLDDFIQEVRSSERDTFAKAHPHPFLVVVVPENADEGWRVFRTTHFTREQVHNPMSSRASSYRALRVVKTNRNPWSDRISVGRAANNDLVVRDASVSKLHAHLRAEGATMTLSDAGSRNGTAVNGKALKEGEARPLEPGDEINLGSINLVYQDPGGMYDFLKSLG